MVDQLESLERGGEGQRTGLADERHLDPGTVQVPLARGSQAEPVGFALCPLAGFEPDEGLAGLPAFGRGLDVELGLGVFQEALQLERQAETAQCDALPHGNGQRRLPDGGGRKLNV